MRRRTWTLAAAAVLLAGTATGGAVVMSGGKQAAAAAPKSPAKAMRVEKGELSSMVTLDGTLTYRGLSDGSPYSVINQAGGTYTRLPAEGDRAGCGDVLYRVDDEPVLLLCGTVPAYRDLEKGDRGNDVRQLNWNLNELGYHTDPGEDWYTGGTESSLKAFWTDKGFHENGALDVDEAIVLPGPARISKVTGKLGGPARAGGQVAQATSDTLEVQVELEASQQGEVKRGDRARITLPGNRAVSGKVDRLGRVARTAGKDDEVGTAKVPAYISLDKPRKARGLDKAPVDVEITTKGVKNALSVPVTALLGRSGGGFAVEVVRAGGRRALVAVRLGLFDTTAGRVQVEGKLREGQRVVVPST